MGFKDVPMWKRGLVALAAVAVSSATWLSALHHVYKPAPQSFENGSSISPMARELARRQLTLWEDPALRQKEIARMRNSNAEWDFMGRTFLVLALCDVSLREPAQQERYLAVVDRIVDETLALESSRGMFFFMMDYARQSPFLGTTGRSIFLDGEIALMLAARQQVAVREEYVPLLSRRIDQVCNELEAGPVMCGESYPDECWMFCNALAAAAIKVSDHVDGRDHSPLLTRWLQTVQEKLIDPATGMLVSSFTYGGTPLDGPEGSSIWMAAHCLRAVDPALAQRQYDLAKQKLAHHVLGFGYAAEWPAEWRGHTDVDSGPIVPGLNASAGSSGLAILGAASFNDQAYLQELLTSLNFAAFPARDDHGLGFAASNQVGDAVLLYALVQGPTWAKLQEVRP